MNQAPIKDVANESIAKNPALCRPPGRVPVQCQNHAVAKIKNIPPEKNANRVDSRSW
jgi:hypothetical protein